MKILEDIESVDRRGFMAYMSALGLGGTVFPGVLWAHVQTRGEITSEIIADAGALAGLEFTDSERDLMLDGLNTNLEAYEALRENPVPNHVMPAVQFDAVLPGRELPSETRPFRSTRHVGLSRPRDQETLAFLSVTQLSELIRTRQAEFHRAHHTLPGTAATTRTHAGGRHYADGRSSPRACRAGGS